MFFGRNEPEVAVVTLRGANPANLPCVDDPDAFFPPDMVGDGHDSDERHEAQAELAWYHSEEAERAKQLCMKCGFRDSCAKDNVREPHGIAGGMTPAERRSAWRRGELR